jgi:DNA-binding response OmpR family regulator
MSKILVVQDQTSTSMSLSTMLSEAGFCVHGEYEARRAIAAADIFDFDAAIVADALPDMTGEQIAQLLRTRDPDLPIFVCTEYDEESVVRWSAQERMLVLETPVNQVELIWLLQAHVGSLT